LNGKFDRWDIANLKTAHRIEYDVQANWKLLVENYSECYHCPLVHPALAALSPYTSGDNDLVEGPFLGGHMLISDGHGSMTTTGGTNRPPLGAVGGDDLQRVYYYSLFPNLLLSLHPDYVMFHTLWPLSPTQTLIVCEWLFDPDTMAQPEFDPGDAVEFWDMTNRQDWHICEQSQIGMRSRVYRPGPLHTAQEALPAAFDQEVLKALGSR
jgi:Rieske 2Fe-2S family protein